MPRIRREVTARKSLNRKNSFINKVNKGSNILKIKFHLFNKVVFYLIIFYYFLGFFPNLSFLFLTCLGILFLRFSLWASFIACFLICVERKHLFK